MEPRLKTSKKWTDVPSEMLEQISQVFSENFAAHASRGQFRTQGRIYPEEVLLGVGYLEKGRLAQANFEVSIQYNAKKENVLKLIHMAVDVAASMMDQYGQTKNDDEIELPRQWMAFEIQGQSAYVQFTTENPDLEAEANRLLGEASEEELVKGDVDEEELKLRIRMLGLDDDDAGG